MPANLQSSTLFPYTTLFRSKRFSLDAIVAAMRRGVPVTRRPPPPPEVERCEPSVAAFAIVAQIGLTYFFTAVRSEEHTSELQSPYDFVCRRLLEKNKYSMSS